MLRLSIRFDVPSPVRFQLYVSHVGLRSIVEYCSPLWSPANVKYVLLLERVRRHATKYILINAEKMHNLSYHFFRREIIDLLLFQYFNI